MLLFGPPGTIHENTLRCTSFIFTVCVLFCLWWTICASGSLFQCLLTSVRIFVSGSGGFKEGGRPLYWQNAFWNKYKVCTKFPSIKNIFRGHSPLPTSYSSPHSKRLDPPLDWQSKMPVVWRLSLDCCHLYPVYTIEQTSSRPDGTPPLAQM